MRNFKKVFISSIAFIILFVIASTVIIAPYLHSKDKYYLDSDQRNELAGSIDCLIIGASHGLTAFDTKIIDKEMNCCSYNLSCSMMTLYGKYVLLKKELERNPVKTVVLELSYDTLSRTQDKEYAIGDEPTIARLDSLPQRIMYLLKYVSVNDYTNIYARAVENGLVYWKDILTHSDTNNVIPENKGYHPKAPNDLTLSTEQIKSAKDKRRISADYLEENLKQFEQIISLCKTYNVEIILSVVPISDALIWQNSNWDAFLNWTSNYCENNEIAFFDFNLIKNRYDLFNDKESYSDNDHISEIGAQAFSSSFCEIVTKYRQGYNTTSLFYSSYESMKKDSPYND